MLVFIVFSCLIDSNLKPLWFVCKLPCFFDFPLDDSEGAQPTHLVLGEVYESCKEKDALNVPRVKETISNRKYVAFDARDLICPVSLLREVTSIHSANSFQVSPWYKVIRTGPVFPYNIHETAGKVEDLFHISEKRKR